MQQTQNHLVEIFASYRYTKEHPWVIQGITGFLSAYYMEKPGFQIYRHFDELETGGHTWVCETPPGTNIPRLIKRLQQDIPSSVMTECQAKSNGQIRYVLDLEESQLA